MLLRCLKLPFNFVHNLVSLSKMPQLFFAQFVSANVTPYAVLHTIEEREKILSVTVIASVC